jgi:hypothetical protein
MAIGRVGSYANIQPVNDPLAGAITFADDVFARKRKEDADKLALQKKEKEAKQAQDEKDLNIQGEFTGYGTPDGAMMSALVKAKEKLSDDMRKRDSGEISRSEYNIRKQNLMTNIDYLKNKAKNINTQSTNYAEMIKKGEVATPFTQDAMRFGGALEKGNIDVEIDEKSNFNYKVFDKNTETGEVSIVEKGNILEFGNESFAPVRSFNFDEDLELFKKNNPRKITETKNGLLMEEITDIGENTKKNIQTQVNGLLQDPDILSNAYYLSGGNPERNITDPKKIQQAKDYLVSKYTNSFEKDIKLQEAVQAARLNRDIQKDKEKEATYGVVETPPEFTKAGVIPRKGYKTVSVTGSKPVARIGQFNLASLDSYTVTTKPDGQRAVTAVITYPDVKTSTMAPAEKNLFLEALNKQDNGQSLTQEEDLVIQKATKGAEFKKEVINLSEKEAYKYAQQMGFENVNQMKDAAGRDVEGSKEVPEKTKKTIKGF